MEVAPQYDATTNTVQIAAQMLFTLPSTPSLCHARRDATHPYMDTARFAKLIFDVMPRRGTGCSLISGLVMQAEACGP
jgi:hypothetical protein